MKNLNLKSVLLVAIAFSFSVITYAQHDHQMMKMKEKSAKAMQHNGMQVTLKDQNLNKAYMHYIMINNALFKGDTKKIAMASKMLIDIFKTVEKSTEASLIASKMAASEDLTLQKELFAQLTAAFEPLLKGQVTKGTIYKNYCPMANSTGAYWFSNSEKIINPYMGSAMPGCGNIKETFKSLK